MAPSDASTTFERGRALGREGGTGFFLALALLVLLHCAFNLRTPAVNRKGLVALAIVFLSLASGILLRLTPWVPEGSPAAAGVLGTLALVNLAAVGLAAVGLRERGSRTPAQRKREPVAAILVGLFLAFGMTRTAVLIARGPTKDPRDARLDRPTPAGVVRRFPEKNFTFRMPPAPWQELAPAMLNDLASIALARPDPSMQSIVIAMTGIPGEAATAVIEETKRNLTVGTLKPIVRWERAHTVKGLDGIAASFQQTENGAETVFVIWAFVESGRRYEIVSWGDAADAARIETNTLALVEELALIERRPNTVPASPTSSP